MFLSRKRDQTCQFITLALQTFLIGVFFFGSLPHVLRRGFKIDDSRNQESFLAPGVLYHVQIQRAAILNVNHNLGIHEPTLSGSFLIRSPPKRDT